MNARLPGAQLDQLPSWYWVRTYLRNTVTLCGLPFSSSVTAVFSISVFCSVFKGSSFGFGLWNLNRIPAGLPANAHAATETIARGL